MKKHLILLIAVGLSSIQGFSFGPPTIEVGIKHIELNYPDGKVLDSIFTVGGAPVILEKGTRIIDSILKGCILTPHVFPEVGDDIDGVIFSYTGKPCSPINSVMYLDFELHGTLVLEASKSSYSCAEEYMVYKYSGDLNLREVLRVDMLQSITVTDDFKRTEYIYPVPEAHQGYMKEVVRQINIIQLQHINQ